MNGLTVRPSPETAEKFRRHRSGRSSILVRRRPTRKSCPELVEQLLVGRLDILDHPEHRDPVFLEALEEVVQRPERFGRLRLHCHDGCPELLECRLHFVFKNL